MHLQPIVSPFAHYRLEDKTINRRIQLFESLNSCNNEEIFFKKTILFYKFHFKIEKRL